MYPLKSIVDFLLAGVSRIAADERPDAVCSMFAGLLPGMSEEEIAVARAQVITRFWTTPEVAEPVVDLIDGHLALRTIFARNHEESSSAESS
jgi:hypothetical protein